MIPACKEHPQSPSLKAEAETPSASQDPKLKSGDEVREAAKDHTLPPYIRESAATFETMLAGGHFDEKAWDQALKEMAATRNEKNYRIWISMLLASEAGLPAELPSVQTLVELEKKAKVDGVKSIESNSLRFLSVLNFCVTYLTQFDMPLADIEVKNFLVRFEGRYGNSEAGKSLLSYYKSEIKNAEGARLTGAVSWKQGRETIHQTE
jgi:hypothetical protein